MAITISGNGSFAGATNEYNFDQSVGVAGTLTYDDVTNVDAVGVVTAAQGINVGPKTGIACTISATGAITAIDNIVTSGRVGIGTDNPDRPLHIFEDTNDTNVKIEATASGKDARLELIGNSTGVSQIRLGDEVSANVGLINYNHSDNSLEFRTNSTEAMRIDSSGNVGIGTDSPTEELEVQSTTNTTIRIDNEDDSTAKLVFHNTGSTNRQISVTSGEMIFGGSGTEQMRIDSDGRLLVGTTTEITADAPSIQLVDGGPAKLILARDDSSISEGNGLGIIEMWGNDGGTYQMCASIGALATGDHADDDKPTSLVFSTTGDGESSPTERMQIDSTGQMWVEATTANQARFGTLDGSSFNSAENIVYVYGDASDSYTLLRGCNTADGTPVFDAYVNGSRAAEIEANGDVHNASGTFSQISDSKFKENIIDSPSQWDDVKALRVRKFNFTEASGYQTHTQIGYVAQEVEQVSPGLVKTRYEYTEDGEEISGSDYKTVKVSLINVKVVKALQEAMAKIETLETKVTALEGS